MDLDIGRVHRFSYLGCQSGWGVEQDNGFVVYFIYTAK
jgi:hypothetical protein